MKWFLRLREAPVTCALIATNLLVYIIMFVASGWHWTFDGTTLIAAGASVSGGGADVSHWRWLTAAFIHANLLHIVMNLWVLGQIGVLSERALGRGLYAAAYVVTGVIGNILSTLHAAGHPQMTVAVGASGAIMGLIGMAATFAWRSGQRAAAKVLAFNILFVLGVGLSLSARGISLVDNAAHIGGLFAGVAIGLVRVAVRRPTPRWLDGTAIVLSFTLAAVAFAVVLLQGG
jgi:rhomboid protease GluP